jgi:uncharacterized RDD family membrane protein YckC
MAPANALKIRTPEGIVFPVLPASPVTRSLAWGFDFLVAAALAGAIAKGLLLLSVIGADLGAAAHTLGYFAISIGYGIAFEWWWRGQTLGKRLLGLRVTDADGLKLRFNQIAIRNLLRAVDMLPGFYLVGGVAALLSRRSQRLGDMAANTVVVRAPRIPEPNFDQILAGKYNSFRDLPHLAARLRQKTGPREAQVALEALLRRDELESAARVEVFRELADHFRALVPFPEDRTFGITDEQYVRNVVDILFQAPGDLVASPAGARRPADR